MKVFTKSIKENLKAISTVSADFVFIDCTDKKNYALYVSTDVQAVKVPLDIQEISDEESQIYVINKSEFTHFVPYVNEFFNLRADYSYEANNKAYIGRFEKNEGFTQELESRKILFDHEDEYESFMEITPSIMNGIINGSIFVLPESVKPVERYLDIKQSKVFSHSKYRIYINDIDVQGEGLLSNEVIKSLQSLGVGSVVKKNRDSYLVTNASRSIFEYFSTPNDVDYHPVLEEKFQSKLASIRKFNKITFNIEELREKLEYISYYAQKNPNFMIFLTLKDEEVSFSTDKNTFVGVETVSIEKTEEFEQMSVPFDCSALQLITSKLGKECENINMFVSSEENNKLMLFTFGDTNETVVFAKLNR